MYIQLRYEGTALFFIAQLSFVWLSGVLQIDTVNMNLFTVLCGNTFIFLTGFSLDHKDDSVEALLEVREKLSNPDHSVLYKTCSELTKVNFLDVMFS